MCLETVNISSVNLCQARPYVVHLILPNPFSFLSQLLLMHYIIFLDPWLASVSHRAASDSSVKTLNAFPGCVSAVMHCFAPLFPNGAAAP